MRDRVEWDSGGKVNRRGAERPDSMGVSRESTGEASERVSLGDDRTTVTVRKVRTRNGARLEIALVESGSTIRLDPLALESLSWQDPAELAAELLDEPADDRAGTPTRADDTLCEFTLVNEFADVTVRGASGTDGDVLELVAPKVGHRIRLTPDILGAIAERDIELFSTFLETPYGPE